MDNTGWSEGLKKRLLKEKALMVGNHLKMEDERRDKITGDFEKYSIAKMFSKNDEIKAQRSQYF